MAETSATLLKRLNNRSDSVAGQRLVDVYSPLINAWLRRQGVSAEDADDLSQETTEAVARAARVHAGATHALVVLIDLDEGPDRIDFGGTIWIAIGLLLSYFIAYLLVLSWADYSYVQPASSASYVLIALLAHFVLHETISPVRWLGVAVICTGVFVVGHTHPKTPEHHSWS